MNNVARVLVDRLTVKFAGEIAQDTDGYDLFKLCEDLFLTENERTSMFREGIQSDDLSKIRCYAEDMKKSGDVKENKFIDVYQNKWRIPLDHEILGESTFFIGGGWDGASEGREISQFFTNWGGSNLFYSQRGGVTVFLGKEKIYPCRLVDSYLLTNP